MKQIAKTIPQKSGVYLFKKKGVVLYVGKAINLKNRLNQYFSKSVDTRIQSMVKLATKIEWKQTDSEIEALILESQLIKKYKPDFNVKLRDDKKYFYVVITNDKWPKILITHQPENQKTIGPFVDGNALKITLRFLRRLFPFCTCKQLHSNFCLNYHINRCLGFCCLKDKPAAKEIEKQYSQNIKAITQILNGKKSSLIKELKSQAIKLAQKQEFEKAIELRNKIFKLEKTFENAKILSNKDYRENINENILKTIKTIFQLNNLPIRIEAYDVSNIQGKFAVASMIVFTNAEPDKNEYRKFKIQKLSEPNDVGMIKQVLQRRLKHSEWPNPDLIFIDGGIPQLNTVQKQILEKRKTIDVLAFAKGKSEIFCSTMKKAVPMVQLSNNIQNFLKLIDSEAHRFAISYYRKLHRKSLT